MIKRLGVLAVAILMGIGIGFAGNAYLDEDATAANGWTFAQFEWQGNGWFWSAGSSDWYGNMDKSQSMDEFLATIPSACQVDVERQDDGAEYVLVFFPESC